MAPMYYRGAHAAIIVYDVTAQRTFDEVDSWVKQLKPNVDDKLVLCIVGNKNDLGNKVSQRPIGAVGRVEPARVAGSAWARPVAILRRGAVPAVCLAAVCLAAAVLLSALALGLCRETRRALFSVVARPTCSSLCHRLVSPSGGAMRDRRGIRAGKSESLLIGRAMLLGAMPPPCLFASRCIAC